MRPLLSELFDVFKIDYSVKNYDVWNAESIKTKLSSAVGCISLNSDFISRMCKEQTCINFV